MRVFTKGTALEPRVNILVLRGFLEEADKVRP